MKRYLVVVERQIVQVLRHRVRAESDAVAAEMVKRHVDDASDEGELINHGDLYFKEAVVLEVHALADGVR